MILITASLRTVVLFFIAQIFFLPLPAQVHYNFIHYPVESGINSYQINTAIQDGQGYMWFAGTNGLQRFDGIRFKTFLHDEKNPYSLPSNPVWQLLIDKKKNLWLLMADGKVGIFNTSNFTFKPVNAKFKGEVSPNTATKKLITDDEGNLFYLVAGNEVITYNENAGEFSYKYNFFKSKPEWHIHDFIHQPGTQKYWMTVENGGVAIYNKASDVLSYPGNNAEHEPAIQIFDKTKTWYNLFFDSKNRLWAVRWEDHAWVNCYSLLIDEFVIQNLSLYDQVKSYYEIKRFVEQKDGTLWVYGLLLIGRFVEGENRFQLVYNGYENEHSIAYEMVHCMVEDRENNIWVCTDNNGLYRFNPSREFFTNVDHVNRITGKKGDGAVMSFVRTKWNTFLIGTWNDGLYQYDEHFNPIPVNIKGIDNKGGPFIWAMCASRDSNTLWLASQPGFYAIDQSKRTSKYFNPPILENSTVRQIAQDKKGNLWLGTQGKGLFIVSMNPVNSSLPEKVTAVTAVPPVGINKITMDSRGLVWIGTPENGLYVLDEETGKLVMHFGEHEDNERRLPERGISSILEYDDSIMLITTATQLMKYNVKTKELNKVGNNTFVSGFITAIEKDDKGYAWITSTSGMYQVDIYKKIVILYNRMDGLDNEHFIQSASYKLPDGRILFGATHNFVLFAPERIKAQESNPDIKITDIKLENKPLNADSVLSRKELVLGYDDKPLVIEFSPFLFSGGKLIKYKIDGLDKTWNPADKTYQAMYNYLPPGTYDFMIKSTDDMGNESGEIVMLKIKVHSPFWRTWWFYSLLTLIAIAILFWLDRERMTRKEAVQKMRSDIANDLHEEVNTALNNINILSEMARIKAETEPQKSKDFIEQIHSKSHNMIIAMDDMLWSISPENDSMEKIISRLKEFIDALKNRHSVQIDLLVDEKVKRLQLNMKQRKDIFWFLKTSISNVVRAGGENCLAHITFEKPNLIYVLEFNTENTDMVLLNNLRQRKELADKLAEVNAQLKMKELKSKTTFQLTVPVNG